MKWATITALLAAWVYQLTLRATKKQPPRTTTPTPEPPKRSVADQARAEQKAWGGLIESDDRAEPALVEYWEAALGAHPEAVFGRNWKEQPWSAAFITYVANKANPGSLKPSRAHWDYMRAGLTAGPGQYRTLDPHRQGLEVGDIIVHNRSGETNTFADIALKGFAPSHGDIVTNIEGGIATITGGNVSNSVRSRTLTLDDFGRTFSNPIAIMRLSEEAIS